jgi:Cu+-exporting ATPase
MSENLKEMNLKADGIICTGCAEDMENVLLDMEGIENASVSFIDNIIQVMYDPDIIDRKHVYMAVRRIAFPLKIISEK